MRKLKNDSRLVGRSADRGGRRADPGRAARIYESPGFTLTETFTEAGFATSKPDWDNGSIGDTSGSYNTWEKL